MKTSQNVAPALLLLLAAGAACRPASAQCTTPLAQVGSFVLAEGPSGLMSGDFNGDGLTDLLAVGPSTRVYLRLPASLGGGFMPGAAMTVQALGAAAAVADFNHDGRSDIAVPDGFDTVLVRFGQPDGGVSAPAAFVPGVVGAPVAPALVLTADFSGDGHADIFVLDTFQSRFAILSGNGAGGFTSSGASGTGPVQPLGAVIDLNHDGRPDVVLATGSGSQSLAAIMLNPNGTTYRVLAMDAVNSPIVDMAAGHFDGDGRADLAVLTTTGLRILTRTTNGVVPQSSPLLFSQGAELAVLAGARDLAVADFNGDQISDVAVAGPNGSASLFLGRGDGTLHPPSQVPVQGTASAVAPLDIDFDGVSDLAAAGGSALDGAVHLIRQGTFAQQPQHVTGVPGGSAQFSIGAIPHGATARWRRNGVPLGNGPTVSGADGPTLVISGIGPADDRTVLDCVLTGPCLNARSNGAILTVRAGEPPCPQDFNGDGEVNADDLADFVTRYFGPGC